MTPASELVSCCCEKREKRATSVPAVPLRRMKAVRAYPRKRRHGTRITPQQELVLQFQPPSFPARGTGKTKGEFSSAGRSIRGTAIGDVDFGRSRELIRRQRDADFAGVPAIQNDRLGLISQEQTGPLPTGQGRIGERKERFETGIVAGRQGHQNVVGDPLEQLMLRRHLDSFGVCRRGGSGTLAGSQQEKERDA